ncbi:MAG: hypothetical protein AAF970_11150 [Bacteroidota bacterium]
MARFESSTDVQRRRAAVLQLRGRGLLYAEIANRMLEDHPDLLPENYGPGAVRVDVHRALSAATKQVKEETDEAVRLELLRLDAMWAELWPLVVGREDGEPVNLHAVDRLLKISERRAKLMGLEAATQIDVTQRRSFERLLISQAEYDQLVDEYYGGDDPDDMPGLLPGQDNPSPQNT